MLVIHAIHFILSIKKTDEINKFSQNIHEFLTTEIIFNQS